MKKLLLFIFLTVCAIFLPFNDAQAASGSKAAQKLWQKTSDINKNLKSFDCTADVTLTSSINGVKMTFPITCNMTFLNDPPKAKVSVTMALPSNSLNIDYYVVLTENDSYTAYFKNGPKSVWQKMTLPGYSEILKKTLETQEELDKNIVVKLKGFETSEGLSLEKMQLTIKNRMFRDMLLKLHDREIDGKKPFAKGGFAEKMMSGMGDISKTLWIDPQTGFVYNTDLDLTPNIQKIYKVYAKIKKDTPEKTDAMDEMLKNLSITVKIKYSNHDKAADFTMPEEIKNATEIQLPKPAVA